MDTSEPAAERRFNTKLWLGISGGLTLLALVLWIVQVTRGLIVTDMRDLTSWGLYIVMFMYTEGVASGALVLATAPLVFRIRGLGQLPRVSLLVAIAAMVLAALFVFVDVGRPERFWRLIVNAQLGSPLMWDVIVVGVFLAVALVLVWLTRDLSDADPHPVPTLTRRWAVAGLILGLITPAVTAMVFGLQIGRGPWNTGLLAPMFITAGLASGIATSMLVALWLARSHRISDPGQAAWLSPVLGAVVVVDLFLLGCELAVPLFVGVGNEYEATMMMLAGPLAPLFWTQIISGVIAAVLLLSRRTRGQPRAVVGASVLILIELFLKRYNIVETGFGQRNLTDYSITTGPSVPSEDSFWHSLVQNGFYFPTPVEIGLAVGLLGFGLLIVIVGLRWVLPVRDETTDTEDTTEALSVS
ncbi:MAG: NrfD/PsrC family molybdoenzyme membrane anchor subunit [Propioniciclava sp.]